MTPAWKSWPLPEPGVTVDIWRSTECAMCGEVGRTVVDHCHLTGLVRGRLCRSCNNHEGMSGADRWHAWREWDNPARALNSPVVYEWGRYDPTPIWSDADLYFLTADERAAWWAEQIQAAIEGRVWPAPITVDITARRAAEHSALRAAMEAGAS